MKLMGKMNYAYVCLIFLFILSCLYIFDFTVRNEHWSYTPFQFLNIWTYLYHIFQVCPANVTVSLVFQCLKVESCFLHSRISHAYYI